MPQYLLNARVEETLSRAILNSLRGKPGELIQSSALYKEMCIWVYYGTSKQNDPQRWIEARVIAANTHFVKFRRAQKESPTTFVHEHVRVVPGTKFVKTVTDISFKEIKEDKNSNTQATLHKQNHDPSINIFNILGADNNLDDSGGLAPIGSSKRCVSALLFTSFSPPIEDCEKDIGRLDVSLMMPANKLQCDEPSDLDAISRVVGSKPLKRKQLKLAPSGLFEKAI